MSILVNASTRVICQGITGNAGQANYAAAKAGLIAFTKSVAKEYGSRNVTVNAVAPGLVATRWFRQVGGGAKAKADEDARGAKTPLGRVAAAEDCAQAVMAFLATDFVTGESVVLDGGLHLTY